MTKPGLESFHRSSVQRSEREIAALDSLWGSKQNPKRGEWESGEQKFDRGDSEYQK